MGANSPSWTIGRTRNGLHPSRRESPVKRAPDGGLRHDSPSARFLDFSEERAELPEELLSPFSFRALGIDEPLAAMGEALLMGDRIETLKRHGVQRHAIRVFELGIQHGLQAFLEHRVVPAHARVTEREDDQLDGRHPGSVVDPVGVLGKEKLRSILDRFVDFCWSTFEFAFPRLSWDETESGASPRAAMVTVAALNRFIFEPLLLGRMLWSGITLLMYHEKRVIIGKSAKKIWWRYEEGKRALTGARRRSAVPAAGPALVWRSGATPPRIHPSPAASRPCGRR